MEALAVSLRLTPQTGPAGAAQFADSLTSRTPELWHGSPTTISVEVLEDGEAADVDGWDTVGLKILPSNSATAEPLVAKTQAATDETFEFELDGSDLALVESGTVRSVWLVVYVILESGDALTLGAGPARVHYSGAAAVGTPDGGEGQGLTVAELDTQIPVRLAEIDGNEQFLAVTDADGTVICYLPKVPALP